MSHVLSIVEVTPGEPESAGRVRFVGQDAREVASWMDGVDISLRGDWTSEVKARLSGSSVPLSSGYAVFVDDGMVDAPVGIHAAPCAVDQALKALRTDHAGFGSSVAFVIGESALHSESSEIEEATLGALSAEAERRGLRAASELADHDLAAPYAWAAGLCAPEQFGAQLPAEAAFEIAALGLSRRLAFGRVLSVLGRRDVRACLPSGWHAALWAEYERSASRAAVRLANMLMD